MVKEFERNVYVKENIEQRPITSLYRSGVVVFYDDFSSSELDECKWDQQSEGVSLSSFNNGKIRLQATDSAIPSLDSLSANSCENFSLEFKLKHSSNDVKSFVNLFTNGQSYVAAGHKNDGTNSLWINCLGSGLYNNTVEDSLNPNQENLVRMVTENNGSVFSLNVYINNNLSGETS